MLRDGFVGRGNTRGAGSGSVPVASCSSRHSKIRRGSCADGKRRSCTENVDAARRSRGGAAGLDSSRASWETGAGVASLVLSSSRSICSW
jgi:hypothetical protein